jgi:hypothetical protein
LNAQGYFTFEYRVPDGGFQVRQRLKMQRLRAHQVRETLRSIITMAGGGAEVWLGGGVEYCHRPLYSLPCSRPQFRLT